MAHVVVLVLCTWICIVDIRCHRIPNELTLLLSIALLFDTVTAELSGFLLASSACILIAYVGKMGVGDVKLFLALTATSGSLVLTQRYFLGMAVISLFALVASIAIARLRGLRKPRSIAFAPSILIPFLALYLAI